MLHEHGQVLYVGEACNLQQWVTAISGKIRPPQDAQSDRLTSAPLKSHCLQYQIKRCTDTLRRLG